LALLLLVLPLPLLRRWLWGAAAVELLQLCCCCCCRAGSTARLAALPAAAGSSRLAMLVMLHATILQLAGSCSPTSRFTVCQAAAAALAALHAALLA
jgi:hypothetical protein